MLFPKYIWMIIGWYSENWYLEGGKDEISCNKTEMEIAVYGHFTTEVLFFSNEINETLDYGIVIRRKKYKFNLTLNNFFLFLRVSLIMIVILKNL